MYKCVSTYPQSVEREERAPGKCAPQCPVSVLPFIIDISIHLRGSTGHTYVEVVLYGRDEGQFLDDPDAHREETMGQVSKLGGFWRCVAKQETDCSPYKNF